MASLNRVFIIGNLGKDPELRYTQNQNAVATFSVATTDTRTGADGQRQEQTEWHNIVVWGKTAENCSKYLAKGRSVLVEGRLQTRSWEDKNGQKRYTTEIVANNVTFLGSRNDRDAGAGRGMEMPPLPEEPFASHGGPSQSAPSMNAGSAFGGPSTPGLDDVPF
jgi:single-strand DNA-binding protein